MSRCSCFWGPFDVSCQATSLCSRTSPNDFEFSPCQEAVTHLMPGLNLSGTHPIQSLARSRSSIVTDQINPNGLTESLTRLQVDRKAKI